jgi:hypothetical protein
MAATDFSFPTDGKPDPDAHERIARLSATLPLRRDADRVRQRLAMAFVEYVDDLWPAGDPNATSKWIEGHSDEMLAIIERSGHGRPAGVSKQPIGGVR